MPSLARASRERPSSVSRKRGRTADRRSRPRSASSCITPKWEAPILAPVYRQPGSDQIYPELHDQLVSVLFDAGLRAIAS